MLYKLMTRLTASIAAASLVLAACAAPAAPEAPAAVATTALEPTLAAVEPTALPEPTAAEPEAAPKVVTITFTQEPDSCGLGRRGRFNRSQRWFQCGSGNSSRCFRCGRRRTRSQHKARRGDACSQAGH